MMQERKRYPSSASLLLENVRNDNISVNLFDIKGESNFSRLNITVTNLMFNSQAH